MAYVRTTWVDGVTKLGPTNMNNLEAGLVVADANATTGIANAATAQTTANAAVPKSTVTTAGDLIIATGSGAVTRLAAGAAGQVLGGTGPSYAYPPGYEIAYAETTSNQTSTATTAAGATQIASAGAVTYDGTTVMFEFFCPAAQHSVANSSVIFQLYDGATDLGTLGQVFSSGGATGPAIRVARRFTPSAAPHTYTVRMWSATAGTTTAVGGAGGAGTFFPFYVRVTKV